jgi:hypothetical protein
MIMFDDALDAALGVLKEKFPDALPTTHIIRNAFGAIIVVIPDDLLSRVDREALEHTLDMRLGQYSLGVRRLLSEERDILDPEDVFESPDKVQIPGYPNVFLVERMLTNQDWVRPPLASKPPIPTLVAFSLTGGVGRSTALAMLAWHLARRGKRVLVIDLDLEEPGIGAMLAHTLPAFGVVDWLTECLNRSADGALLARCVTECPVAFETRGSISVIPTYGVQTLNYISKLGRIYTPTMNEDEQLVGLAERLQDLVRLAQDLPARPDVILMDAHAGFHDIGAAAVIRLGAEALLFSRNDPSSWWAYKTLFEYLRTANSVSQRLGNNGDLRQRMKMIGAQSPQQDDMRREWIDASYATWRGLYDGEKTEEQGNDASVAFDRTDAEAPHYPLFINFDPAVRALSLTNPAAQPEWNLVQGIFGDFFSGVEKRLWPSTVEPDRGT